MANRTVKDAVTIKGTNPQYLIEKIIRSRIYESKYWKEECFALTAELLVDKAIELRYVGGHYGGNVKPTPFLCLILKMLQIQPEKDIIIEFIRNDHKYVRALGAFYMRMTGTSLDCYKYLEPLLNDYRKIRVQNKQGEFELSHMDEFIDSLLTEERVCDCILPRLQKRMILEDNNELEPRISALDDDDMDDVESSDEEGEVRDQTRGRSPSPKRKSPQRRRSRSPGRKRSRSRDRSDRTRDRDRERDRGRERGDRDRDRERGRSDRDKHKRDRSRDRKRQRSRSPRKREHRRSRSRDRAGGSSQEQLEIDEANALRAKLGLAPLRP